MTMKARAKGRVGVGRASRRSALLVTALCASGCLRPSEERARRDEEVGQAEAEGVTLAVVDGLAAVYALERERAELWANAPSLRVDVAFGEAPPARFELIVQNCGLFAELSSQGQPATRSERDGNLCRFELELEPGEQALALELGAPGVSEPAPFRFAVLSDIQEALPRVQDIYDRVNEIPDVEFLLAAGDLTERGTSAQLEEFQARMRGLAVPYYVTLGNHELGVRPPPYHDYFGRGNASFVHRGVRFTLLDSASATLDPIVYDWLDEWLRLGFDQPHIVAMHIAPLDPVGVRNGAFASRAEAAKLLGRLAAARVDLTLYGHVHSYYSFDNAGIPAHISGGGGAIPERFDDIGRHFLVIDADPIASTFATEIVRVD